MDEEEDILHLELFEEIMERKDDVPEEVADEVEELAESGDLEEAEEELDEIEDHITGAEGYGDFESADDYWNSYDGEID